MNRYVVSQFDSETFVVVDTIENRETCICGNYDEFTDAEARARMIADALNEKSDDAQSTIRP